MYTNLIKEEAKKKRRRKLWEDYRAFGSQENRNAIIEEYAFLVRACSDRLSSFLGSAVPFEVLSDAGITGLIEAVHKFNPSDGEDFEKYSVPRIRKCMVEKVTQNAGVLKTITDTKKRIDEKRKELKESTGSTPDDAECAKALGMSLMSFVEAESAFELSQATGFDTALQKSGCGAFGLPAQRIDRRDFAKRLGASLAALDADEKKVVLMFYHEELTEREIAEVLDIPEWKVSKIHVGAMQKMQVEMAEYMDVFLRSVV